MPQHYTLSLCREQGHRWVTLSQERPRRKRISSRPGESFNTHRGAEPEVQGPCTAIAAVGDGQRGRTASCQASQAQSHLPGSKVPWGRGTRQRFGSSLKGLALSSTGRSAPACAGLSTNPCSQQVSAYQPATDTAAALREETPSHYVTEERRSRNPSFTKPSRQIQRLTH